MVKERPFKRYFTRANRIKNKPTVPGESSSETENPYGRMHVTEPVRATIPVQNGARLSWDPWIVANKKSNWRSGHCTLSCDDNFFFQMEKIDHTALFSLIVWMTRLSELDLCTSIFCNFCKKNSMPNWKKKKKWKMCRWLWSELPQVQARAFLRLK